jgi:hypothetical protein
MTAQQRTRLASAEELMRARLFGEAIGAFDAHLRDYPDDLRALLKVGICHLLNRSERMFVAIHQRAQALLARLREVPRDIARLWRTYNSLLAKVTATALLVGVGTLAGCGDGCSAHRYSGGVYKPPVEEQQQKPEAAPESEKPKPQVPFSGHKYSGGVYEGPEQKPAEKKGETEKKEDPAVEEEKKPVSSHRYSGGVYLEPRAGSPQPG